MKRFCVKVVLPIVPAENPNELGGRINKALEEIAKDCPFVKIELNEYNPAIFDDD